MKVTDNPGGVSAASSSSTATLRRVSLFDQININVFWIANNFHWQALLAIVIPSMVVKYLGNANKDINLTLVIIWGTLIAVVVNPLVGSISRLCNIPHGTPSPIFDYRYRAQRRCTHLIRVLAYLVLFYRTTCDFYNTFPPPAVHQ